jgi:hypothetical protein
VVTGYGSQISILVNSKGPLVSGSDPSGTGTTRPLLCSAQE